MGCIKSRPKVVPSLPHTGTVKKSPTKDFLLSKVDFIRENKGEFRDYYKLGSIIANGSMSEVRKCQLKQNGKLRAVKIIRKETLDEESQSLIINEVEIMRELVFIFIRIIQILSNYMSSFKMIGISTL